jgi:hypothetical protein
LLEAVEVVALLQQGHVEEEAVALGVCVRTLFQFQPNHIQLLSALEVLLTLMVLTHLSLAT